MKPYNTFAINASATTFTELNDLQDLPALLDSQEYQSGKPLWLGGGSNIVFCRDIDQLVVKVSLRGIRILEQTDNTVLIEAAAGGPWHEFVQYTLSQGWYGLENLSLIPGTVGASPVQNIGAYGVEAKDRIDSIVCADLIKKGAIRVLDAKECEFAYRDSIFKHTLQDQVLITAVRFRLSLNPTPQTGYGDIQRQLVSNGITGKPTPQQVADAVISLRRSKLPDPAQLGNAGSFFKNPIVDTAFATELLQAYPTLPHYPAQDKTKLAAGWLIDHAGLKGFRMGNVGVHMQQALVLVNYGDADGTEIRKLAEHIQTVIFQKYSINLDIEPLLIV